MSKLDREIKAVIDDIGSNAEMMIKELVALFTQDDFETDDIEKKLAEIITTLKPKTYDVYIEDFKNVFKQNGWQES